MAQWIKDDATLKQVLSEAKVIAVVGHSDKPERTSYQIAQFLRRVGYTVYPVNPTVETIDGEKSYATLQDIPEAIDIVDVFRRSEFLDDVVNDAQAAHAKLIWGQLGVVDDDAARKALEADMDVVMDRCIKVEYSRLMR